MRQSSHTSGAIGRRCALAWTGTALVLLLAPHVSATAREEGPKRRPNIVFLLADDLRPDTIAALGNPIIKTPNLDRLVRRGTAMTRAVSAYPLCVPSRAEILTGCSAFRNGVFPPFHVEPVKGLTTWPEALRGAGYHTWFVGKWHIAGRPTTRGFERSLGLFGPGVKSPPPQVDSLGRAVTGYTGWVFQDDDRRLFPEKGIGLTENISAAFADAAIAFIESRPDRPYFLHVNFTAPHDPLLVPPGYRGKYDPKAMPVLPNFLPQHPFDHGNFRGRDEQLWPWPRTEDDVRAELALYYAVISHLDAQIGRILDALERAGQSEKTIIIFSSDHGLALGSHGLHGKQNMYEHTIGVPLVLAGPGIPQGQRRDAQVYLRELYPTLCELVDVAIPATVEGSSFATILRDPGKRGHESTFAYFEDSQRMVRGARWKLIRYPKVQKEQLFDLAHDPFETKNLADEPRHAALITSLRTKLEAWQDQGGDPIRSPRTQPE
jgi:arylsulfatase A-like enzyme